MALQPLNWWLQVTNTAVVSAVMIYMLLKQRYSDKRCIPKKLAQSVFESGFQSVPGFSHVWLGHQYCFHAKLFLTAYNAEHG